MRSLKNCDEAVQDDVFQAVELFEKGNSTEALKLHKLHGKFKPYHAFSATFSYRIIIKIDKKKPQYVLRFFLVTFYNSL